MILKILLLALVVSCLLGASTYFALRALVRRVKVRVSRASDRLRLSATAHGHGPRAEVARLRLELGRAVLAARQVVETGRKAGWSLGDAPSLVRRLSSVAESVDSELRALETERDPSRLRSSLPAARARVGGIVEPATSLREALLDRARQCDQDELARLRQDCDIESAALRAVPQG